MAHDHDANTPSPDFVTARFGSQSQRLRSPYWSELPLDKALVFTPPAVKLTARHLVAALWVMAGRGVSRAELANPDDVRNRVAEALVGGGLDMVDIALDEITEIAPGSIRATWLAELSELVCKAFTDVLPARADAA